MSNSGFVSAKLERDFRTIDLWGTEPQGRQAIRSKRFVKFVRFVLNPFKVGRLIPDEYFCDRDQETATLIKHVTNGRNVALISPRRLGKSVLI